MTATDDLKKAIALVEQAANILQKSQMAFDFTVSNPHAHDHHVAYTRTNASGTVSNIKAKGAPHPLQAEADKHRAEAARYDAEAKEHEKGAYHPNPISARHSGTQPAAKETDWKGKKEKLGDATQAIIGRRTISAVSLHEINGTHEGATGALIQGGKKYDAVKHKGNWHLTGDYTQQEQKKEVKPNANAIHEHYPWGRLTKVEGKGIRAVLHPEHQEAIGKLQDGDSTRFKDEQGIDWTAKRNGEHVELKAPSRVSGTALRVKHSDVAAEEADVSYDPQPGDDAPLKNPQERYNKPAGIHSDTAFDQIKAAGGANVHTTSGHIEYHFRGDKRQLAHTDAADGHRYVNPAELKQHLDAMASNDKSNKPEDMTSKQAAKQKVWGGTDSADGKFKFRDWETGDEVPNYEGEYTFFSKDGGKSQMHTWMDEETGERAHSALTKEEWHKKFGQAEKHQALIDGVHKVGNDLLQNPMMAAHHDNIRRKLEGLKANPTAKYAAQVAGDLKLMAEKAKTTGRSRHQVVKNRESFK